MSNVNSINTVILVGYVSTEVDFKKAKDVNTSIARFSLATNEVFYYRKAKEPKTKTEFHYIVAWGSVAEFCDKWLKKGRLVAINGTLRHRTYKDEDGKKRRITEVHVDELTALGKREDYEKEVSQEEKEEIVVDPF